jgi:hypothetical protein
MLSTDTDLPSWQELPPHQLNGFKIHQAQMAADRDHLVIH